MKEGKLRKEVHLTPTVIESLQLLADRKKWHLKTYMEAVLASDSKKSERLKTKTDAKQ